MKRKITLTPPPLNPDNQRVINTKTKFINHFAFAIALMAFLTIPMGMWGQESSTWNHAFSSPEAISNNSITVNNSTWAVSTTAGAGSPTISTGSYSQIYGLKFGSSKSIYFGSVTFSTDYFNLYNVESVTVNILNNGEKQGTFTATQGNIQIGSETKTFGQTWTNLTATGNEGAGGTLSFTYSVQQAFFLHSITVVYNMGDATLYTVTYKPNGPANVEDITDSFIEGANVTIRNNPFYYSQHIFTKWNTAADGNGANNYNPGATIPSISGDVVLYAQWRNGEEDTDVLNYAFTGISGTSYTNWSGKAGVSGAVYAGNTCGNSNNRIQLRNTNNSGIISTASGGKIRKVSVTWNSSTSNGRTLDIYGNNTAYSAASDLYSNNTQGTKLGSIVYGTSTELVIVGDYDFIGLRASDGTMYLDNISIIWSNEPSNVARPSFSLPSGTYGGTQEVTITAETGADIYYTTDGTTPSANSSSYSSPIEITESTVLKAIAIKNNEVSRVATASYTIEPVYETMQAIYDKAMTCSSATPIFIRFDNWVVSGVSNTYAFVTDGEKGFVIYNTSGNHGFSALDVLNGTVQCNVQKYQTTVARVFITKDTDGLTVTEGGTISHLNNNVADLSGVNTGALISYDDMTCTSATAGNILVSDGSNELKAYTALFSSFTSQFSQNHRYQIKGIYFQNGSTKQFCPRSGDDIVELEFDVTLNQPEAGGVISTNISKAKYGETVTLTATPSENYRFQSWSVMFGETSVAVSNNAFTMPNGNVTVSATFIPVYDITIPSPEHGTVTADFVQAAANDIVTLTITPESTPDPGYALESLTVYKTGEPSTTVNVDANNQFTMPAYAVTVNATFAKLYSIEIDDNIQNGTVAASLAVAPEGTSITLTATPVSTHYELTSWYVLDGEAEEVPVTINSENPNSATVTMPASDIVVSSTFTQKTYTITYCVNGNSHAIAPAQVLGGNTIGTFPTDPTYGTYSFLGWAQTEGGNDYVSTSYIPTVDMTLYAVFGTTGETTLTITGTTSGIPTSYGSGNWTIDSKTFYQADIQYQNPSSNPVIQFKKNSGYLYNTTDFGAISSIVLTYYSGTAAKVVSVKAGTTVNPASADAIEANVDGNVYTYALPENCHYVLLTNGNGTSQVSSIEIYYEAEVPVETTITRISDAQTISSLSANQVIVVENGGVLTYNGTNTVTSNIIVEEGGQLITSNAIAATVQKDVEAYSSATGAGNTDGWYFIASPVNSNEFAPTASMLANTYDLYRLNPTTNKWENYKAHDGNAAPNFKLENGRGYLYANSAGFTIDFAGVVRASAASQDVSVSAGWNLVGNPFTYNAYVNRAYYKMNEERKGIVAVNNNAAIAPCTGVVVEMSTAGDITFTKTAQTMLSNGNVQIALAQTVTTRGESSSQTLDNAIVSFNEGSQLEKFYFGTQDANIYIPQNGEEFAIVSAGAQGEMPVNFKAAVDGTYTINVEADNVTMNYLHLIDNLTGADVDLLANPSYTFNARNDDYTSRFRLVFSANGVNENTTNDNFAFISNGQIILTEQGDVQVYDVMGRLIKSVETSYHGVSTEGMAAGVYVIRLTNGSQTMTQKIVVR